MKICRFMILVFTAYSLTILNAKTDSKKQEVESLDSKTTACHTEPLGEVSKTLESKKDISCLHTRYDKKLDSTPTNHANKTTNFSSCSMALEALTGLEGRSYLSDNDYPSNSVNRSNCIDKGEFSQKLDTNKYAANTKQNLDSNSAQKDTTHNMQSQRNNNTNKEETHEYPLLDKKSKDELFGTINTAEIPDAIPAPLTTKALLSVEDWRDTYFIYLYNFTPMENPLHIPNELKGQISFRVPLSRNIFKSGGILYFAFTDTFFFQVFNEKASSPVRDNDFQPEFLFTYPMNVVFWGGTLTELTTGWRHISNGEIDIAQGGLTDRSRGSDRWIFKARWTTKHWGVDMEAFAPVRFYPENPFIYKYLGSLEIKMFMRYNKHLADATITGLLRYFQPGKKIDSLHGGLRLSYTYKLNPYYGVYIQYFVGYGDYLYEYDKMGHRIGIGVRFVR
ncbi:phospholipase A [Helicobacter bilis]|uniref:phospholipase A n=1 Tax=Helicobacter bilis TaxID=37372 RepID=UPI00255808F0|nr:phospholipase A [Helicobacter bilis]